MAEDHNAKHGTSEVNDEFLKEIEGWREALSKNIALRNAKLTIDELNFAVQKIIDRIIFLRMCEDRGTEPPNQIQRIADESHVYRRLVDLFQQADMKYNSGIFHFQQDKKRVAPPDQITITLKIDDGVLVKIIEHLYYPESAYQFDVIPADILGQVYEQFLGKVIRLTEGHHAKVEEKPEVKKAGGVYYTPTYIVNYIVDNTLRKLCSGKSPTEIAKLRILDPACGSGSFLISAYEILLKEHLSWYISNEPKKWKNEVFQGPKGDWRLTLKEKKRILLSGIFGVDIDSQAVEVTKLNLLLKALEGESMESVDNVNKWFREPALPDLGNNIKCGNSLVDFDILEFLKDLPSEEQSMELHRINPFNWINEFPQIFKDGGFDVVIGNPPYVRSINLKIGNPFEWEYCRAKYVTASSREWDIYLVFVERMLKILRTGGKFGYILPNKFLTSKVGENLRSILSKGKYLERLIHFGAFQIFKKATTYTCLLFLNQGESNTAEIARYKGDLGLKNCPLPYESPEVWNQYTINLSEISALNWETTSSEGTVLSKIRSWPKLGTIADIFSGTGTRADRVFLLESHGNSRGLVNVHSTQTNKDYQLEPAYLRPALRGKSIGRYSLYPPDLVLIVPYEAADGNYILASEKNMARSAPNTFKYLEECKERLNEREKGRFKGNDWFCYGRPQNMNRFSAKEKIVMPDVVNRGECFLDLNGYWAIDTMYIITLKSDSQFSIKYILGILNSPLLTYFLKETGSALRGGYFRMKTAYLTPFPIRTINFTDSAEKAHHDRMVSLVDRMLKLNEDSGKATTPEAKMQLQRTIEATDKQIDALVYELYGLTEDEVRIVESSSG